MGFAKKEKDGFGSQVNLRLAAMKTSKWLSFGRVLFSPAHVEVMQPATPPAGNRVLVIDGLGNGKFEISWNSSSHPTPLTQAQTTGLTSAR
jgi:hypothetical protein